MVPIYRRCYNSPQHCFSTLLAIHLGFAVVIILAVLIYGLAAIALRSFGGFA